MIAQLAKQRYLEKRNPKQEVKIAEVKPIEPPKQPVLLEPTEEDFAKMFGLQDFQTTKANSHVKDSCEATYKQFIQQREHKQVMNKRPSLPQNNKF